MIRIPTKVAQKFSGVLFKYSWGIIVAYTLAAIVGVFYTVENLGINSDTSEMFDESMPFRQTREHLKQIFPETEDNFVIVVSGHTPELVSSTADSVAAELKLHPHLFESVYLPTGEDFFKSNQLLFLDSVTLVQLSDKIFKSRPMLVFLSNNYSLKGLFSFFGLTIRFSSPAQLDNLNPVIKKMDSVLQATLEGKPTSLSWQTLMGESIERSDGGYSFIQIKPRLDYSKLRPAKAAIETARAIVDRYKNAGLNVRITGKKAMTYEEMGSVVDGAVQASIFALVLVSLILWLGLKSARLISATLLTLLVGLILTAWFSAWAVGHLNMISIAFAVLYIGLGVDYAIHVCLRYRELKQLDSNNQEALTISIRDIGPALILSTLSTSIGFYAFVPTDFAGVSELGIIAGTGMFISLLVTVTLLPCLILKFSSFTLRSFKQSVEKVSKVQKQSSVPEAITDSWQGFNIAKYRNLVRIGTLILTAIALWLLPRSKFDSDPINLRNPKSESVATIRELMENQNFTPWTLNALAYDSSEVVRETENIQSLPSVDRAINLFSFIPKQQTGKLEIIDSMRLYFEPLSSIPFEFDNEPLNAQLKAINDFSALLVSPAYAKSPDFQAFGERLSKIEQLDEKKLQHVVTALQSNLLSTLPYSMQMLKISLRANPVKAESLPQILKERWQTGDGVYRIQVFPKNPIKTTGEMREFASSVHTVAPNATGDLTVTIASGDTVVNAFKQAIFSALIAIALLLLFYLRNIRDTIYILMPLLLAGVFTGAVAVLLGVAFNFANIIALPLLLGLGVDNGVHIVHRARSESTIDRLLQTSTARAILFSSLTTLFSFGNLAFSPHRGTASMGWLLTIGVVWVVIATLLILPAFLPRKMGAG